MKIKIRKEKRPTGLKIPKNFLTEEDKKKPEIIINCKKDCDKQKEIIEQEKQKLQKDSGINEDCANVIGEKIKEENQKAVQEIFKDTPTTIKKRLKIL